MAWQQRSNRFYYYRAIRVNGRPAFAYLGNGEKAHQAAAEIEARKQARQVQHHLEERQQTAVQPLLDLTHLAELLLEATLLDAGFHYYQRHWRKKREYRNRTPNQ
jgi:hypothetical protein